MDRADRIGLGVAFAGHLALLAALSLGLAWRKPPVIVYRHTPTGSKKMAATVFIPVKAEMAALAPRDMLT